MDNILIQKQGGEDIFYRRLGRELYTGYFIFELNGKFGIINSNFKIIIPAVYENISLAFENHFWGKSAGFWHLFNFSGKAISELKFKAVDSFINQYANASVDGENFGFINRKAEFVIAPKYGKGSFLGLEYFLVSEIEKFAVIDIQENIIIPFSVGEKPNFSMVIKHLLKRRKPLKEWLVFSLFCL